MKDVVPSNREPDAPEEVCSRKVQHQQSCHAEVERHLELCNFRTLQECVDSVDQPCEPVSRQQNERPERQNKQPSSCSLLSVRGR